MRYNFRLIPACVLILFVIAGSLNADLTINLTDDGGGGTNIEFVGTGTVISTGSFFAYRDPTNGFTNLASGFVFDNLNPAPILGGSSFVDLFVTSAAGGGIGNESIQSNWIGVSGGALNSANGQILNMDGISFSIFNPGSYAMTLFPGSTNVGSVTLNIGSVIIPEPGSIAFLGVMSAAIICTRRRRINRRR